MPVMGPTEAREEANSFQVGQVVKVKVPLNVLRMIQEGHGGYTPKMSESMQLPGEVTEVTDKGDLRVRYANNIVWTLNPEAVQIVSNQEVDAEEEPASVNPIGITANFFCVRCRESLRMTEAGECFVCSENEDICTLEPCGHKIVCIDCSARLRKCCTCSEIISKRVAPDGSEVQYIPRDQRPTIDRIRYLDMQVKSLEERITCNICLERRVNRVFKCGHSCCSNCSSSLYNCHICRLPVTQQIQLFLS
ncbi:E3 ubiquitin-protein ligase MIB2-like [Rhodnius prolixus]|uniref:RING-type domain-containing protein n=1 Tax=Rhodnius prolixus TaxID=13249 RepID=A0ABL0DKY2_RHOPR